LVLATAVATADGPGDNLPDKVRRVPAPGVPVPDDVRKELQAGAEELARAIDAVRTALKARPDLLDLLPDVQVYHKAVDWALRYNDFNDAREFAVARKLVKQGLERAQQLMDCKAPWTTATGLVVRGYVSRIDGSVQPYGLVVPESYRPPTPHKFRLDLWWHGRDEKLSDLKFINDRQTSPGQFTPANTFVLHPYGRYCNANKFAGEVDTFEAMEHVKKHYPIDENRVVARGFSMGGAACWQFATHFPDVWCAAAPGAGFAETADFLKVFQNEPVQPTEYEKKLWHWYDATDYAANLYNLPTVAYSGEIDRQKQAADMMAKALKAEGMELVHLIGPKTAHAYHPETKKEVSRRIDALAEQGRPAAPDRVKLTTYTLRYNRSYWLTVSGLEKHWARADVDADLSGRVTTRNVHAFSVEVPYQTGRVPPNKWIIDGQEVKPTTIRGDAAWSCYFRKVDGKWLQSIPSVDSDKLLKRHELQGPIDDAFMDRFLMVRPTGQPLNDTVGSWSKKEMDHAIEHWRRQFRGDAPVKDDTAVSDADIASSNLILWGDPSSNKVLAKIADRLPVRWTAEGVRVGDRTFPAGQHVPVLIYPNPLNPKKYVVLNSGFTFREYDYLNNARQVPKLPDYAVLDVSVPPTSRAPGKVVLADFFDEQWKLK
jgi:dienelactone hydrolase